MTIAFRKGRLTADLAVTAAEVAACQALRHLVFLGEPGHDADDFDPRCTHVMIRDGAGTLIGTFRLLLCSTGAAMADSYSGARYDLAGFSGQPGPAAELGRFCVLPGLPQADVLRMAWVALTRFVLAHHVRFVFGCASFAGADAPRHAPALALLRDRHLGPPDLRPGVRSAETVPLAMLPAADPRAGIRAMPPLLKSYLALGAWVGDHAVIDRDMDTLHVFTGLDIASIPPNRARALRAVAD